METTTQEPKIQLPGTEPRATAKPRPKPSTPPETPTSSSSHLLGADGRDLVSDLPEGALSRLCGPLGRYAERNPKGAALLSLGVGLVAGAILGVAVRRD
jgi:hypothetical protein